MKWISTFLLLLTSLNINAAINIDDSSLSTGPSIYSLDQNDYFRPDNISVEANRTNKTEIIVKLNKNDNSKIVTGIKFNDYANCTLGASINAQVELKNKYFNFRNNSGRTYDLLFTGVCGKTNTLNFTHDSFSGEAIGIWNIFNIAVEKFTKIDRIDFWSQQIKIKWPSNGDYYQWGSVNITKGFQWDVVGHELGHAIYDQANIGRFGGGAHRIDQCYSSALALSEGWASFFSAWLSVELDDKDAKFEYMVPRRAPLEIEHVPADVCKGPTNEWRVYSFLWDLIDLNKDNEAMEQTFQAIWDLNRSKNYSGIIKLKEGLIGHMDPVLLNIVWEQNIEGI